MGYFKVSAKTTELVITDEIVEPGTAHASQQGHKNWFYRVYILSWSQICLVSFIAFCLPGMYNALSGIGGGGNVDPHISAQSSIAITATAAASYFFLCLPVFDLIGVRAMGLAGWTYPLYSGSLLNYAHRGNGAFVVAAGALVGCGSAFLWTVQGALLLSYPLPHQKGRAIGIFWVIFNLGGMIGAFIAFGQNYNKLQAGTVTDGTYWGFIAIMLLGTVLAWTLCDPQHVVRSDGTHPIVTGKRSLETKLQRAYLLLRNQVVAVLDLRHEIRLLFLLPMFFSANYFYSYQQNIVNGISFDLAGRTLNSALYWGAQMIGGLLIGGICDIPWLTRPRRALLAWVVVFAIGNGTMGGGLAFENMREKMFPEVIPFRGDRYARGAILYFFYGMVDALWQGYTYWLLGAMCSTPEVATRLVAVYKATQGVGSAIGYVLTANNVQPRKQFISNWVLVAGSLAVALIAVVQINEPTGEESHGGMTQLEKAHLHGEDPPRRSEREDETAV